MKWFREENFYACVLLLLILIIALRTPLDSDMWWHLRAGEETITSGQVYRRDTLSYTRLGEPWINHSWLSQVIMIGLFRLGSYRGLAFWVGLVAVGSIYFLYRQLEGGAITRMGIGLLAGFISSVVWSPRPQIFSLLFFSITGWIIYRFKWNKQNNLIWLLPVFIVWSNLHAGFVLGVIYILVFAMGEIINRLLDIDPLQSLDWKEILQLIGLGLAGYALSVINPNGIGMWSIPFQTVGVESLQNLIQEWASPDFHQPIQQLMLILLFGTFVVVGLSKRALDGSDLAVFVTFGFLALIARRNFGPFALVASPVLARHLTALSVDWQAGLSRRWTFLKQFIDKGKASREQINKNLQLGVNVSTLLLLLFAAGFKGIKVTDPFFVAEREKDFFPRQAVEWLEDITPQGRLFNIYNWGGYLTWNLRDYRVFVDGRTDLFGDQIINQYVLVESVASDWERIVNDYGINIMLIEPNSPLVKIAPTAGWNIVYQDPVAVIFTRQ